MADLTRIVFSDKNLALEQIARHYADVEAALQMFFSVRNPEFAIRFATYSQNEVEAEFSERTVEHGSSTVFTLLAAVEAVLRIDYLQRCYRRKKDPLSRALRKIHTQKGSRASLEEEILPAWRKYTDVASGVISDLRGALKYRHWLAHGRYWVPKLGRKYEYHDIYALAHAVFAAFPLEGARSRSY